MIVASAVLLALGALVFTLFVRRNDAPDEGVLSPAVLLEEKKSLIFENLRDLQFEYRVGKLSDADYQEAKRVLQRELAGLTAGSESKKEQVGAQGDLKPASPKGTLCPKCGASFPQPLKFCGECGAPMSTGGAA